ncbi:ABC-2 type transport system permease protein [Amycolatopsis bartoniae]|uniref:ABC transporter permease n=1 Tax=Amycolatopsis bartoniae TaxID=941986 RepID=A0A8H9IQV4_9PSEU|nr:ABC transporter permease subunit [Amycolatopsis bartoniae]MBB2936755.1 ABC-2 type transport system permease protein [Amycolatopsis bartoniae]TVT09194.1 ABC transporter permease subunit [Amycolatopsis bartoniae]GHF49903.1 ABC transporter permease [Amycolatopsis bartoniae]
MIGVELRKLVLRPRVWASVLLLCLLPAIVAVFLATADFAPPPGQGGAFLSAVVSDGTLYPAAALALVLPLFLPIAVAVTAGDAIAGEAAGGTLRYLLVRPVGRTRVLTAKLVAIAVYATAAIGIVVLTSLVIGVLLFGTGAQAVPGGPPAGAVSLSGVPLTSSSLALRLLGAVGYIVLSMVGFAAITLFLSTVTESAVGAALGGLAVLITSSVLETLDAAAPVKPYLPTHYWLSWLDFFRDPVLWRNIDSGLLLQAGYIVVFFGAAWANFATKDITD